MSGGVIMGLATYASGPIYAAYGGRTYLLMAVMGVVSVAFSFWLARAWHGGRITRMGMRMWGCDLIMARFDWIDFGYSWNEEWHTKPYSEEFPRVHDQV